MPELTVSEELYRQLEAETDEDMEDTLWDILGTYRRMQNPGADTE